MKISEIAPVLHGQLTGKDVDFIGASIDTRQIKSGDLFIAIQGEQFDGHDFINSAKESGAVAAIVNKTVIADLPLIKVKDTRIALGQLAALHRAQFDIPVIGLTGSCGKTTTKEMLRAILSECGLVAASVSSFNNDIGVPLTLLDINKQHQFAVVEMGANHPGEIAYLTQMVKPTLAFILNVAPAHLEGFGSVEGVMQAKSEIFEGLPKNGIALVNADDRFAPHWYGLLQKRTDIKLIKFGIKQPADYFATHLQADAEDRYRFKLVTSVGEVDIQLPLFGEHYVLNAVAAAAAAHSVGADLTAIKNGLQTMQPAKGRLVKKVGLAGASILDDTYNAIPHAVAASLRVLAKYPGERVFAFGGMREIGETAAEQHIKIGELAKTLGIQRLYACGQFSDLTVKAFGDGGYYFTQQAELADALRQTLHKNMTVLVKGSRGSKMENVVSELVAK